MLRRLTRHFPRLPDRHTLTCAVALLSFVGGSVGFPLEPLGTPKQGCCCGDVLRDSGGCCCQNARAAKPGAAKQSCCAKPQPRPKSCCRKTDHSNEESDRSDNQPVAVSACSCGGFADFGYLINAEPRILPRAVNLKPEEPVTIWHSLDARSPQTIALDLDTPPPKSPATLVF